MFFDQIRAQPPLVGSTKPLPRWLPAPWESRTWPLLDDLESILQWLRLEVSVYRGLAEPDRHKYLVPGDHEDGVIRDCYRLVTHLVKHHGFTNPPDEPQRTYSVPKDATAAVDELYKVCGWVENNPASGSHGSDIATVQSGKRAKRSTVRGEGREKLIAALTKHHKYADGGCLNLEPIGNNELARLAEVSESTASAFFNKQFDGHTKYRAICADAKGLATALKLLNQEFAPHHLFGTKPPGEQEVDDDE